MISEWTDLAHGQTLALTCGCQGLIISADANYVVIKKWRMHNGMDLKEIGPSLETFTPCAFNRYFRGATEVTPPEWFQCLIRKA